MNRAYEMMVIIDTDVADADNKVIVDRVEALINDAGGELTKTDRWGRRKFAYLINHKAEGIYALLHVDATVASVKELDRQLSLNEAVMRTKVMRAEEPVAVGAE